MFYIVKALQKKFLFVPLLIIIKLHKFIQIYNILIIIIGEVFIIILTRITFKATNFLNLLIRYIFNKLDSYTIYTIRYLLAILTIIQINNMINYII